MLPCNRGVGLRKKRPEFELCPHLFDFLWQGHIWKILWQPKTLRTTMSQELSVVVCIWTGGEKRKKIYNSAKRLYLT